MIFRNFILILILYVPGVTGCSQDDYDSIGKLETTMSYKKLTPEEEQVIVHKSTETPFSGKYETFHEKGIYYCKRCSAPLYRSDDKFDAGCGWPSFDDQIPGAIKQIQDTDGLRTEIVCARCAGHLGHIFFGEGLTAKNTRHCVNSISLDFNPEKIMNLTDTAILAGGCFWGMEYYMKRAKGVLITEVGYTGGAKDFPTYQEVCSGKTGHYEAIKVVFNPEEISFLEIVTLFFEIHDPTQWNHQGPDWGEQYRSAVFFRNEEQKKIAENLIRQLKEKGYLVVTEIKPVQSFWKAEDYHQDYYDQKGSIPYCHGYVKRF